MHADALANPRLILYHKSPTSARTQFLLQGEGVCLPGQLPQLAQVLESDRRSAMDGNVISHPSPLLRHAAEWLAVPNEILELDPEFHERVGGRFIALTEGRGLAPAELDLLRRAYSVIMED